MVDKAVEDRPLDTNYWSSIHIFLQAQCLVLRHFGIEEKVVCTT